MNKNFIFPKTRILLLIPIIFQLKRNLIVSNLLLPLGSLVYLLFCTSKYGWGFKNYQKEANIGKGLKVPDKMQFYVTVILPIIVIFVFISGII